MTVGWLTQLILECDDAERLARFWQQVLDLPEPEGDSDWLALRWEPVGRFSLTVWLTTDHPRGQDSAESSMRTSTFWSTIYTTPASRLRRRVLAR